MCALNRDSSIWIALENRTLASPGDDVLREVEALQDALQHPVGALDERRVERPLELDEPDLVAELGGAPDEDRHDGGCVGRVLDRGHHPVDQGVLELVVVGRCAGLRWVWLWLRAVAEGAGVEAERPSGTNRMPELSRDRAVALKVWLSRSSSSARSRTARREESAWFDQRG